jgi:hypothetical protein
MLVVPQPLPMPLLVSLLSDWREVCATSPAVAGEGGRIFSLTRLCLFDTFQQ